MASATVEFFCPFHTWRSFSLRMMEATSGSTSSSGPSYWNSLGAAADSTPLRQTDSCNGGRAARRRPPPQDAACMRAQRTSGRGCQRCSAGHGRPVLFGGTPSGGCAKALASEAAAGRLHRCRPFKSDCWLAERDGGLKRGACLRMVGTPQPEQGPETFRDSRRARVVRVVAKGSR